MKIKNKFLLEGEWGADYDPETRTMLGGYSVDGDTFSPEFQITEIEEEDVPNALIMCSSMYSDYGMIAAPYRVLVSEYMSR